MALINTRAPGTVSPDIPSQMRETGTLWLDGQSRRAPSGVYRLGTLHSRVALAQLTSAHQGHQNEPARRLIRAVAERNLLSLRGSAGLRRALRSSRTRRCNGTRPIVVSLADLHHSPDIVAMSASNRKIQCGHLKCQHNAPTMSVEGL